MKFSTATAVCGLALGVLAMPTFESALPAGYTEYIPEWEVELYPGGPMVKARGTVEEVRAEMIKRNPDFETHYPINTTAIDEEFAGLDKRTDFSGSTHYCGNMGPAKLSRVKEGISYLRGLKGQPTNGPGPAACGRVSCSWNSGIWWCNNDTKPKTLLGWGSIADGAYHVMIICSGNMLKDTLSGEAIHPTQWSVRVGGAKC